MRKQAVLRTAGGVLVALGVLGLFTVADDTRHLGELGGVASVLTSGLAFLGAATGRLSRRLALQWLPAGLAAGLMVGLATDSVALSSAGGFVLGLALAFFRRDGSGKRQGSRP